MKIYLVFAGAERWMCGVRDNETDAHGLRVEVKKKTPRRDVWIEPFEVDGASGLFYADPNGSGVHVRKDVSGKNYSRALINHLEAHVRETAYNLCRIEAESPERGEAYSRAVSLYELACQSLRTFSETAEEYIRATYNPATVKGAL